VKAVTPAGIASAGSGHAKQGKKPNANVKRYPTTHGKAGLSPGRAKHAAGAPPGLAHAKPAAASDHATGRGASTDTSDPPGQAKLKHVATPRRTEPKNSKPPVDKPKAGPKQSTPAKSAPTAPVAPATAEAPVSAETPQTGDTTSPSGTTNQTSAPTAQAPAQAPTTQTQAPPSTPTTEPVQPPTTPPSGSTGDDPGSSNNGWDNGKKLGHYNENQDGKHLVGS
jgi:hypothetical protein